jgi:hypothetical protein
MKKDIYDISSLLILFLFDYHLISYIILGHIFEAYEPESNNLILRHVIETDAFVRIGALQTTVDPYFLPVGYTNISLAIRDTLIGEFSRSAGVKRSFTGLGQLVS